MAEFGRECHGDEIAILWDHIESREYWFSVIDLVKMFKSLNGWKILIFSAILQGDKWDKNDFDSCDVLLVGIGNDYVDVIAPPGAFCISSNFVPLSEQILKSLIIQKFLQLIYKRLKI